jgi:hypothetical protein
MISGIGWVSELIEAAGGIDVFADRTGGKSAKERIVTAEEIIARAPDIKHRTRRQVARDIGHRTGTPIQREVRT